MGREKGAVLDLIESIAKSLIERGTAKRAIDEEEMKGVKVIMSDKMMHKAPIEK